MTRWQTPLCPFTIEFAPDKLDEIRMAVLDGFYAIPRGGVEIGGVLFGKHHEGTLQILDFRKIKTEYLNGPSFSLSADDQAGLQIQLAETKFKDPGISPVGWFVSHNRSAIHLPERDLEFYRRFFPDPWQVTLVLKPDSLGKVLAGYFFRDAGGVVKADASAAEFSLEPYWGDKQNAPEEIFGEAAPVEPSAVEPEKEARPPIDQPLPPALEPALFQPVSQQPGWSLKKQILLPILVAASIAAAVAGYWAANH